MLPLLTDRGSGRKIGAAMLRRASAKLTRRDHRGCAETGLRLGCARFAPARSRLPSPVAGRRQVRRVARATTRARKAAAAHPNVPSKASMHPLYGRPLGAPSSFSPTLVALAVRRRGGTAVSIGRSGSSLCERQHSSRCDRLVKLADTTVSLAALDAIDRITLVGWRLGALPDAVRAHVATRPRARQPPLYPERLGLRSWRVARSKRCPRCWTRWS